MSCAGCVVSPPSVDTAAGVHFQLDICGMWILWIVSLSQLPICTFAPTFSILSICLCQCEEILQPSKTGYIGPTHSNCAPGPPSLSPAQPMIASSLSKSHCRHKLSQNKLLGPLLKNKTKKLSKLSLNSSELVFYRQHL